MMAYESGLGVWIGGKTLPKICILLLISMEYWTYVGKKQRI